MANIEIEVEKIRQAIYGEEVRGSICDAILAMNAESTNAMNYASTAKDSAAAKASEASSSAEAAQSAAETAAEDATQGVETRLSGYVLQASTSAAAARSAAETAAEDATQDVEDRLSGYVLQASTSAAAALSAADLVSSSLVIVQNAEARALQASSLSRLWAEGPGGNPEDGPTATNNSKYWSSEAARIAQSITGGLTPMGSVLFVDLPLNPERGWMYKIIDDFVTDNRFDEGAGNHYNAGTQIYFTGQDKWTVSEAVIDTIPLSYIDGLFS